MGEMGPIQVQGLNHFFGAGDARKQVIFDINLTITKGSLTILIGPSGSGKTTLLTLIGALRDVQEGSVGVLAKELRGADEATLVQLRQRVGFIFQAHNLYDSLTATQNELLGLPVHGYSHATQPPKAAQPMPVRAGPSDTRNARLGNPSGGT